jgi:hypothetical protein
LLRIKLCNLFPGPGKNKEGLETPDFVGYFEENSREGKGRKINFKLKTSGSVDGQTV